jgi:hypothetical protein
VNLGSTPAWQGKFTITDAAILSTSKLLVWQAPGPYTGKGARADEAALAPIRITHVEPAAGSAVVHWRSVESHNPITLMGMMVQVGSASGTESRTTPVIQDEMGAVQVRGKVKGNVKFTYMVL